jgi:hypothetical protein
MKRCKSIVLIFFACQIVSSAAEVRTPPIGSSERLDIINVLRLDFYKDKEAAAKNPKKIIFVVKHLKVKDGWACVNVQPTREGKEEGEARWMVLRTVDGRWADVDYFGKLFPFESEEETLDALDMKNRTVDKLLVKLPGCPKEIFP